MEKTPALKRISILSLTSKPDMNLFQGSLFENVRMGLDTLWQHKLRSALTVLGVVIGTMTVIVIAAFVSGIDARVSKEIE